MRATQIFGRRVNLSPIELLEDKLSDNPYHPFEKQMRDGIDQLIYEVRYKRFYGGVFGLIVCITLISILLALNLINSSMFLWPVLGVVFCVFAIATYINPRVYILLPDDNIYLFKVGEKIVTEGPYHNIYIRLMNRRDSGRSYYYLILYGFGIDKQVLCDLTMEKLALRSLGQEMATNLGINYFDEANESEHHVIRHQKLFH